MRTATSACAGGTRLAVRAGRFQPLQALDIQG